MNKILHSCRCVNVKEWEEAQVRYPHFANEERLNIFLNMKIKGKDGIAKPFRDYCQAALNSVTKGKTMPKHSVHWKNSVGNFIEKPYHQATKDDLMEAIPTFQGSSLIVLGNIVQVRIYGYKTMYICTYLARVSRHCISCGNLAHVLLFKSLYLLCKSDIRSKTQEISNTRLIILQASKKISISPGYVKF